MIQPVSIKPSAPALVTSPNWTPDQIKLITSVVAKGATQDELKFFLYRCEKMGLDPLKPGQIHFVKYGQGPGSIVVGIDGFRAIAARTGKISGVRRGVFKDESGKITGAWCEVHRKDWTHPAREEVPFSEYDTGKNSWAKMPETMIKKVAEAATLRMAFPDDLGGVYEGAELEKRAEELPIVVPGVPEVGDGYQRQGYRVTGLPQEFGRYNGKMLQDFEPSVLRDIVTKIEASALEKKKAVTPKWMEFIELATPIIADWENQTSPQGAEPGWDENF